MHFCTVQEQKRFINFLAKINDIYQYFMRTLLSWLTKSQYLKFWTSIFEKEEVNYNLISNNPLTISSNASLWGLIKGWLEQTYVLNREEHFWVFKNRSVLSMHKYLDSINGYGFFVFNGFNIKKTMENNFIYTLFLLQLYFRWIATSIYFLCFMCFDRMYYVNLL